MNSLVCLITLYVFKLSAIEATINICIPLHSDDDVTTSNADELFQDITNDVAAKLNLGENQPNLYIDHIDVNITHPAIRLNGTADDVSVYNLLNFDMCFLQNLNASVFNVFNLTFTNIRVEGIYNLTGDLGDIFYLYGDGDFWIEFINFSIAMTELTISSIGDDICLPVNIEINLQEVKNHFYNFMYDEELEDLFNRVITNILPESFRIVWPEIKEIFDKPLEDAINKILHNKNVLSIFSTKKSEKTRSAPYCYSNSNTVTSTTEATQ